MSAGLTGILRLDAMFAYFLRQMKVRNHEQARFTIELAA